MLWFAFILLSLSYWKQPPALCPPTRAGCDLLSFYYLCRTGNNHASDLHRPDPVVICFHFTIFVVLETTNIRYFMMLDWLWFAFILLSLSYWKQHDLLFFIIQYSCDLLSFYYLCRTGNNKRNSHISSKSVVICFHFTIFVVLETTPVPNRAYSPRLWFAFILLSLSYWKQHEEQMVTCVGVVICFHFTIFVVLETTVLVFFLFACMLWFAFILLSLSYWKQHHIQSHYQHNGCDLLSFYYLCRTGNNKRAGQSPTQQVVICFHFTIFVVLETTTAQPASSPMLLWFAFILLSLSYWKQPYPPSDLSPTSCDLLSFYYLCRTGNNL